MHSKSIQKTKPADNEIVIVAFDVHLTNDDKGAAFKNYKKLSVSDKIALFKKNIIADYEITKEQNPFAKTIIFVAREYAIQGTDRRSISVAEKKELHKEMLALTKDRLELVIIPGPVLIRKKLKWNDSEKLESYITPHQWIANKEFESGSELKGVYAAQKEIEDLGFFSRQQKYKTTAYVYAQGKIIGRIGKIAVRNEPEFEPEQGVTQLAKGKSLSRVVTLPNGLRLGLDICNDHTHALVLKEAKSVDIHFVLSDGAFAILKHLVGEKGSLHLDSAESTRMFLPKEYNHKPMLLYRQNILKEEKLVPMAPIFPLQFYFAQMIKNFEASFPYSIPFQGFKSDKFSIANLEISHFMQYQEDLNSLLKIAASKASPSLLQQLKQIQDTFFKYVEQYGLRSAEMMLLKSQAFKFATDEKKNVVTRLEFSADDIKAVLVSGLEDADIALTIQEILDENHISLDTELSPGITFRTLCKDYDKSAVIQEIEENFQKQHVGRGV